MDEITKLDDAEEASSVEECFPWISKLKNIMDSSIGNSTYQTLEQLLSMYARWEFSYLKFVHKICVPYELNFYIHFFRNISRDASTCYSQVYRSTKLKNHIGNTLTFFHFYWRDISEVSFILYKKVVFIFQSETKLFNTGNVDFLFSESAIIISTWTKCRTFLAFTSIWN